MMYTCLAVLIFSSFTMALRVSDIERHKNFRKLPLGDCGESMSDRIIGGKAAAIGKYPWLARLGYSLKHCPETQRSPLFKCGGSLITELHVISAAHCVTTNPIQLCIQTGRNETLMLTHIVLGEHIVDQKIDCELGVCADPPQTYGVVDIIYHGSYNNPPLKHDISIIKLHKPVIFTGWISPICLPEGEMLYKNVVGHNAEVAGWGIKDIDRQVTSNILLYITVPIVKMEYCIKDYFAFAKLTSAEICAGGVSGVDSCGGDSGGPLMIIGSVKRRSPRYYLLGVVSFGASRCGEGGVPAVYTSVPYFMPWILKNLKF